MRYFDSSALVKRYVDENGSAAVRKLLQTAPGTTSRLAEVEIASALIRRALEGALSTNDRDRLLDALQNDLSEMLIVEVTGQVTAQARGLLERHHLRAADAVHIASCLHLGAELGDEMSFVAFDARLSAAARAEGLVIER